jgi:hypothetical protein
MIQPMFRDRPCITDYRDFGHGPTADWPGKRVGASDQPDRRYGVLNQNFFSANVAETEIQPILGYEFNDR